MTGWPQAVVMCGPIARARMSEVPPGAKGTTMRIGLFGYCWPRAGRAANRLAARAAVRAAVRAAATRFMDVPRVRLRAPCVSKSLSVGRACRDRTYDQRIKSPLLYQLS